MVISSIVAVVAWPPAPDGSSTSTPGRSVWVTATIAAFLLIYRTALQWLPFVFAGPLDVNRGDMLVVTEAGVRRVLEGRTPYAMYHVPWEMTLSYGPMLWGPFVLPVVLHADLRVLTLICFGFVGAALVFAAARAAARRQWQAAAAVLLLAAGFAVHPSLRAFFPTGHTFVYWPLLVLFCALLATDRWTAAAAALGLLIAARSTMVALAPVFVIAAHQRQRLGWRTIGALAAASIGPFVPFLIVDPRSVQFSMYGAYQKTIKGFVWTQTSWVQQTFGVTSLLLEHGLQRFVEPVQIVCLAIVYACAWRSLRRGHAAEPWLALALLVFSMTTLWPVTYLYFDVWVLLAASFAFRLSPPPRALAALGAAFATILVLSTAAVLAAGSSLHATYDLDVGTAAAAPMTGGGFGTDQRVVEGQRDFVWVEGTAARVRAPRASLTAATIAVDVKPFGDDTSQLQQMRVSVNGRAVGEPIALQPGWQTVSVVAPAARWTYGFNLLTLEFSRALPEPGTGRQLSAGIDRIRIR